MCSHQQQDSAVLFSYGPALADGGQCYASVVSVMPVDLFSNFHVFQSHHLDGWLNHSFMVLFLVCGLCLVVPENFHLRRVSGSHFWSSSTWKGLSTDSQPAVHWQVIPSLSWEEVFCSVSWLFTG